MVPGGSPTPSGRRTEDGAGRSRGFVDYERVAALYSIGRSLSAEVLDRWAAAVRPFLPPEMSWVVDVGAGTGLFAEAWPSWASVKVIAVEPADAMLHAAPRSTSAVTYVRGVAEALPLRDLQVDVVWVSTALHHFRDAGRAVQEFARVLRPGGRALVRTYVPGRTNIDYAEEFPGRSKWAARFQSEEQLRGLFGQAGLDVVSVGDVLEGVEPYSSSADWVALMRDADSMFTALNDDEIATGLDVLRSQPDRLGRLELTLLVFERS